MITINCGAETVDDKCDTTGAQNVYISLDFLCNFLNQFLRFPVWV